MNAEKVAAHIINWLKDYVDASELKGFTIGVSGGIDSAVTSTLCARTGYPVIVLNMPIHQASDQVSRACEHIAWLSKTYDNVTGHDVNLTPVFEQIKTTLPSAIQDGLTMANTRARLRMITLYAFASHHRMLVTGTGNKVEDFGVGFYTKYGDGGVDISPIGDLMKTEVYALGHYLGVSRDILSARPTDGLWEDNRTDESQIGASYDELEWAMTYDAGDKSRDITDHQKNVLEVYRKFNRANRHKMEPIPVCTIPGELKL
ncbi:MAG: NAD(+) synthase [Desulfobacter postgatei]|uniref:NAD(+) synthase n=1 Tax=Desulfobacter postgatei TaxID=2293 RepID=UPI0023F40114|nr:NAD(+) synthase [Desulfobacter postgatei]MDD4272967.1 NAD(+) synthase [Desulfobacter postgatei]